MSFVIFTLCFFFFFKFIFYFVIIIHFRSVNWYSKFLISNGQSTNLDTSRNIIHIVVAHTQSQRSTHVYLQSYTIISSGCWLFFSISLVCRLPFAVCPLPRKCLRQSDWSFDQTEHVRNVNHVRPCARAFARTPPFFIWSDFVCVFVLFFQCDRLHLQSRFGNFFVYLFFHFSFPFLSPVRGINHILALYTHRLRRYTRIDWMKIMKIKRILFLVFSFGADTRHKSIIKITFSWSLGTIMRR